MFSGESCVAAGRLQSRPASQVDESARVGRRATRSKAMFHSQHLCAGLPRCHDGRRTRHAEAHDDDIDRLVETNCR